MRDPTDLPSKWDGCGASLTLQHALDCKVGGLVIQRHNEIRDCMPRTCRCGHRLSESQLLERQKHK